MTEREILAFVVVVAAATLYQVIPEAPLERVSELLELLTKGGAIHADH